MRVIYRSASRVRRVSGWQPFLREMAEHALSAILPFVKKRRVCRLLLNVVSWLVVPILLLLVGVLVTCDAIHKLALRLLLDLLRPDDEFEVEWNKEIVSFVLFVEGVLNQETVQVKLSEIFENKLSSLHRTPKIAKTLFSILGVRFWKTQRDFNVANHVTVVTDRWRGVRLSESSVRFRINELSSIPFHGNHPPWHVHLIPFVNSTTLTPAQAVLIRAHCELIPQFSLDDVISRDTSDICLKRFISSVLKRNRNNASRPGWIKELYQEAANYFPILFEAPRIIWKEILTSCYFRFVEKQSSERDRTLFWLEEIPRDLIRKIKEVSGASSRAVLLSCVSGALREYFRVTGIRVPDRWRCLLPLFEENSLSSFESLSLPLDALDPVSRLYRLKRSIKRKGELSVSKFVTSHLPSAVLCFLVGPLVVGNSRLSSNVVHFLGLPVTSVSYWNSFHIRDGLHLSMIHYSEKIIVSVMSRANTLQWPDLLTTAFRRQMYDLALSLDIHIERKPSPPSSPTRAFSVHP